MRTVELLTALAQDNAGIQVTIRPGLSIVTTGYEPRTIARGVTLLEAATVVATDLMRNPKCPPGVRKALEEYDEHTKLLQV